ncbi:MAG: glycosyltransferase family 2 protein [Patescibacteria group bacterium]
MHLSDYQKYRILEILPGFTVWFTLIAVFVLSFIEPLLMIYFIIAFDLYWLMRVFYFISYLGYSWYRYRKEDKINWLNKVKTINNWENIYHLIFLPTYGDDVSILETTFAALVKSDYPLQKFIIILAGEEREGQAFNNRAKKIQEKYSSYFYKFIITIHPKNQFGEVAGKGSNINYAGHLAQNYIDSLKIKYENVIVSAFDIDTCVSRQYFSYLTYKYLTHPNPTHASYQPLALYNNNVWESPSFTRVVANSTTFWLMTDLARPERLFTFSSHSMSFKTLVDVGFWQNDIVTEDSRIFLQCFIHYDGDYQTVPMFVTVSMDTAYSGDLWGTIKNQYKQIRRWAWGVEHFPFMFWHFIKAKKIPWSKKMKYMFNLTEGMYSWATAPLLILILGRLPLWVSAQQEKSGIITQTAPHILQWLMTAAMLGILASAIMNVYFLPKPPKKYKSYKILIMLLQWILLPITIIIFGSIPAIDAQTRLMLGKYLGFYTTKKLRK